MTLGVFREQGKGGQGIETMISPLNTYYMEDGRKDVGAEHPTGPRGGITTVTKSGLVKKYLWISGDAAEALRQKAFDEKRSEAAIIREGLRVALHGGPQQNGGRSSG